MAESLKYYSAFNNKINLQSIVFSNNSPLLEQELNEIQDIQNENRQALARALIPSGFTELVDKSFSSESIIYQPLDELNNNILNSIAIAPCKAILNGINVNLIGNFSNATIQNYLLLNLGEAPSTGVREDLVYLEVWLERATEKDSFKVEGYVNGKAISYQIVDPRINQETSSRIIVHYAIKVAKDVDFQKFPNGLGYTDINNFSDIQATADGSLDSSRNKYLIFKPANYINFKDQRFYKDNNLYVAGMPDYTLNSNTIVGNFIYALPMLRIKRRNKEPYSLNNYNGARTIIYHYDDEPSVISGDLLNNIRPDQACYDILNENDVIDLRKSVLTDTLNTYYLNKGLKELFTGNLYTKDKPKMRRVQFGRQSVDYTNNDHVILHVGFDNNIEPTKLENLTSIVSYSSNELLYTPIYKDAILAQGLYIDGRAEYKYILDQCNINHGTLDFYIQPYWNGHSEIIQTLFTIIDVNGNNIFKCIKNKQTLILEVNKSVAGIDNDENKDQLEISLANVLIFAKHINIFRFAWDNDATKNYIIFYINGKFVARITYAGSVLIPQALIIGDKTDAENNAGLIITDFERTQEQEFYDENIQEVEITEDISNPQIEFTDDNEMLINYPMITVTDDDGNIYNSLSANIDVDSNDNDDDNNDNNDDNDNDDNNIEINLHTYVDNFTVDETNIFMNNEKQRILDYNYLLHKRENERKLFIHQLNNKRINYNYGFVIEELVLYNTTYEENITSDNTTYFINNYWPGLPNDFINGEAIILPSFNSLYRGFSDINLKQDEILQIIFGERGLFTLPINDLQIDEEPIIYKINGEVNSEGQILTIPGTWHKYDYAWVFQADDLTLTSAVVQYSITTPAGNGGDDLPDKILAAGFVTADEIYEECSFARKDDNDFRQIQYFHATVLENNEDSLYDHSTIRTTHQSFTRILYYNIIGNGNNEYYIPNKLYGYPVLYILYVTNREVLRIRKVDDTDEKEGQFIVWLKESVSYGETIELVIALGGTTFDYNTHTKTLVSNILRTQIVSFVADGIHNQYLIPIYTQNGGILQAACSIIDLNDDGDEVFKYACYVDGEMYPYRALLNSDGTLSDISANPSLPAMGEYQLAQLTIDESSWHTPFMKIALNYIPNENSVIEIPMLVSYQPTQSDVLSIWYNYTPYQGILNNNKKQLKRLTEWKYFITTLASGKNVLSPKQDNIHSLNNLVNRLPGGNTFASYLTGEKIIFNSDIPTGHAQNLYNNYIITDNTINNDINTVAEINNYLNNNTNTNVEINILNKINQYLKKDANYELRFLDKALFSSINNQFDDFFFELDTYMEINKNTIGFQDDTINYAFNKFKLYLPDTLIGISKYIGMACLVVDELGQLLLFIIGSINNNNLSKNYKTTENVIEPICGDLFKLTNAPTILLRS